MKFISCSLAQSFQHGGIQPITAQQPSALITSLCTSHWWEHGTAHFGGGLCYLGGKTTEVIDTVSNLRGVFPQPCVWMNTPPLQYTMTVCVTCVGSDHIGSPPPPPLFCTVMDLLALVAPAFLFLHGTHLNHMLLQKRLLCVC